MSETKPQKQVLHSLRQVHQGMTVLSDGYPSYSGTIYAFPFHQDAKKQLE